MARTQSGEMTAGARRAHPHQGARLEPTTHPDDAENGIQVLANSQPGTEHAVRAVQGFADFCPSSQGYGRCIQYLGPS
jgi:hypothetical protein